MTTAINGLAGIAGLCQAPSGEAKPALFRGAVRDPAAFFGEPHIQKTLADPVLRLRAGLFRDQDFIDPAEYPGEYTREGIMAQRASGASLTLRGVQRIAGPVREVCQDIASTGWPTVHAVALESPDGVQALATHWDCNPVIAVQTAGRKRWAVWRAVPAIGSLVTRWKAHCGAVQMMNEALADEVVLEPGDAYFIPAGWPHAPVAAGGTSLHVSICPLPQAVVDEFGNEDHFLN